MIEVRELTKSFGKQRVLSRVSFQAAPGQVFGLIGYNGVGKTTLLKTVCGIYRPDSGSVRIGGEPVYENPAVKQQCFFMTEESPFFAQSTMNQMRRFYRGYCPGWRDRTFLGLADWFGVDPDRRIGSFSKGMQRQAGLTLALATHARCLFLDEAFDGLDFTMRRQVSRMLLYYAREKEAAVIVSSHNLRELEGLANRIGMLSDGELVFNDTTKQMQENYQTCRFRFDGPPAALDALGAELLEWEEDGYLCILRAAPDRAREALAALGARDVSVRPVRLEEFFRKERKEKDVDFQEIFG